MSENWKVTVWGVRGSVPAPFLEFMQYGGNTACISVSRKNHMVIFDAGTGLLALGKKLDLQKDTSLDIFFSHLHIDHVMGLFSFQPFLCLDMEIHLYGGIGFEQRIKELISPPWWPLRMQDFKSRLFFHEVQSGDSFRLGSFTMSALEGNHPDGSLLYCLDSDKKRLVYALDYEHDEETCSMISDFSYGSDLIVWDANFVPEDFKKGWGHSTWEQGIKAGHDAMAKRVLMTHYSHEYTDEFLQSQEIIACKDSICIFAKEGMEITL